MIHNAYEYRLAAERLLTEERRSEEQFQQLQSMSLAPEVISRIMESLEASRAQLAAEVDHYERLQGGETVPLDGLGILGRALVAMRIAQGLSQQDLADRLGVDRTTISHSERHEYRGITLERAARLLAALGVALKLEATFPSTAAAA